jgi:hypothetical protein
MTVVRYFLIIDSWDCRSRNRSEGGAPEGELMSEGVSKGVVVPEGKFCLAAACKEVLP